MNSLVTYSGTAMNIAFGSAVLLFLVSTYFILFTWKKHEMAFSMRIFLILVYVVVSGILLIGAFGSLVLFNT